ncbi:MAG: alpha/beta hydrolase [Deltaproteobacteria bacterium]|jgi:pimeloyl-ACP methyl ester carboxylesterase|nr:alpha/beta hydrolase [Deltaproteobacteria bacterium]
MVESRSLAVDNRDGWVLDVRRVTRKGGADPDKPPVLFVPGYGMNTFILGYHPRGASMVEFLCAGGYEVWLANLRGQGDSMSRGGRRRDIDFASIAHVDLPVVVDRVLSETTTNKQQVHVVGCSLGGAFAYAYLARTVDDHSLASLVSLGGPFRWDKVHPLIRVAARQHKLLSRIPIRGTRRLAKAAMPIVKRVPALLSPYMNARAIDLSKAGEIVQTVDDPPPGITRELGAWIVNRHLVVGGIDVGERLRDLELPILCVLASSDGIVPPESVTAVREVASGPVDVLEVGRKGNPFAHADLFINDEAEVQVFGPLRDWLDRVS